LAFADGGSAVDIAAALAELKTEIMAELKTELSVIKAAMTDAETFYSPNGAEYEAAADKVIATAPA
jgi:hypothetical protein